MFVKKRQSALASCLCYFPCIPGNIATHSNCVVAHLVAAHLVIAGKAFDYNCPGSTSFSLGGKLASYFSNSSGIRSVTK